VLTSEIRVLDVVAVLEDVPRHGLVRGEVGTVIEHRKEDVFEIAFSNTSGKAYAFAALRAEQLLKLNFPGDVLEGATKRRN
jgi:hypothetical protein